MAVPLPSPVPVVTVEQLAEAIRHTLVPRGKIPPERAEELAAQVLSYFGTEETVLDNVIAAEDRDTFYQLEEEGLLGSEEEDALVARGKTWRIHYWLLKKPEIAAASKPEVTTVKEDQGAVYQDVPSNVWSHGNAQDAAPPAEARRTTGTR